MTAAEVLNQFRAAGGKGPLPDCAAAERLALAINSGEESVGLMALLFSNRALREAYEHRKKGPSARLEKALLAVSQLALHDAEALALVPPFVLGWDRSPYTQRAAAMIAAAQAAQVALRAMIGTDPFRSTKPRRAEWHDDALRLAGVIKDAYIRAGRKRVSFGKEETPGISVLQWALTKTGYQRSKEAIVAALRRSQPKI